MIFQIGIYNLNDMIYSALNLSHILQNYQLPACSVFIRHCLYTHHINGVTRIIKAEIRFSPESTRWWYGVYTDHPGWSHLPGPTRTTTDVLNYPKRPCWHPGSPRITPDVPGQTRTTTDQYGSYTVHMPDHPGCDPCWSGTYMGLGLYRRTPCSSVIVCIPTMLTESHGSSRQIYGFPRNLHGGDTVSTRITPDEAISPDQHGRPRMFWTFQNVRVGIPVPHGSPRTFLDKQGPLRTYTAATRFICRITPDVIRVDPAPIWDWWRYRFPVTFRPLPLTVCVYVVGAISW